MTDLASNLSEAVRNSYCSLTAPADRSAALLGPLLRRLGQGTGVDPAGNLLNAGRSARNLVCGNNFDDGKAGAPVPFQGGQCPGDAYVVQWESDVPSVSGSTVVLGPVSIGPVQEVGSGILAATVQGTDSNGDTAIINLYFSNQADVDALVFTDVSRQDGGPDVCGNPPRDVPPYSPDDFTDSPTITFTDETTNNNVTLSPTLVFAPVQLDVNNDFVVPVDVTVSPEISFSGDFNVSTGDFEINANTSVENNFNNNFQERSPEDLDESEDVIVVGARVVSSVSLDDLRATELGQGDGVPSLYVPRLANVFFRYAGPDGSISLGRDHAIKQLDNIVLADRAAVGAIVIPQPGVTSVLTLLTVSSRLVQSYW